MNHTVRKVGNGFEVVRDRPSVDRLARICSICGKPIGRTERAEYDFDGSASHARCAKEKRGW